MRFTLCLGPQQVTVVWIRGQCQSVACAELPRTGPGLGWSCLQTPPSRACWPPSPPQDPLRRETNWYCWSTYPLMIYSLDNLSLVHNIHFIFSHGYNYAINSSFPIQVYTVSASIIMHHWRNCNQGTVHGCSRFSVKRSNWEKQNIQVLWLKLFVDLNIWFTI